MNIPFRVKLLTKTAKAPTQENEGDLWDLYADDFCVENIKEYRATNQGMLHYDHDRRSEMCLFEDKLRLYKLKSKRPLEGVERDREFCSNIEENLFCEDNFNSISISNDRSRAIIEPKKRILVKTGIAIELPKHYKTSPACLEWSFNDLDTPLNCYAVADIRPRSGLALKHGITVLNTPGTIDNSYRQEIGIIIYNAGDRFYSIKKGDKIAQMLIRPLYPSKIEIVSDISETARGGFGSTGN